MLAFLFNFLISLGAVNIPPFYIDLATAPANFLTNLGGNFEGKKPRFYIYMKGKKYWTVSYLATSNSPST